MMNLCWLPSAVIRRFPAYTYREVGQTQATITETDRYNNNIKLSSVFICLYLYDGDKSRNVKIWEDTHSVFLVVGPLRG